MTKAECVKILRYHNQWRRGKEIEMTNPVELGKAIDKAVELLSKKEAQNGH